MASPAEIVRQYLVDQGLVQPVDVPAAQTPGDGTTPCYVSSLPDEVDQAVLVKDAAGLLWGKTQADGKEQAHPGIKVLVRSLDHSGYAIINAVAVALAAARRVTVTVAGTEHFLGSVYRSSGITDLGEEMGKKRFMWSYNARVSFQDAEPQLG